MILADDTEREHSRLPYRLKTVPSNAPLGHGSYTAVLAERTGAGGVVGMGIRRKAAGMNAGTDSEEPTHSSIIL
jgi:hypothetical protein